MAYKDREKRKKYIIRQIWRGLWTLPQCGEHPGTYILLVILAIATLGGWGVFLVAAAIFVPMYLYGAYIRAETEDRL